VSATVPPAILSPVPGATATAVVSPYRGRTSLYDLPRHSIRRIKPDDAQAHNNLGNVLAEQGLLTESIAHYQQALHLNADNPEAHCNLGMALAREGRRPEAVKHFAEALRLKPDYEQAKRQLESIASDDRK